MRVVRVSVGNRSADQWQLHAEGRAMALSVATRFDRAAVQLDELAHDGEAQAEPAALTRRGAVGLTKAFEDVRQELRIDPLSGVGDTQMRHPIAAFDLDGNGAPA